METKQPEALRLADAIKASGQFTNLHTLDEASAELRRQHARIAELEAQLSAIGAGGVSPLIAGAVDAKEKRWLDIGKAVERACEELPDGAEIIVSLERGAGTVTMIDWDGNEHDNFPHDDGFGGVMNSAIDAAIAAQ